MMHSLFLLYRKAYKNRKLSIKNGFTLLYYAVIKGNIGYIIMSLEEKAR